MYNKKFLVWAGLVFSLTLFAISIMPWALEYASGMKEVMKKDEQLQVVASEEVPESVKFTSVGPATIYTNPDGPIMLKVNPDKPGAVLELDRFKPTQITWKTSRLIVEGDEHVRVTTNRPNIAVAVNGDDQTFDQFFQEIPGRSIKLLPGWQVVGINKGTAEVCMEIYNKINVIQKDCVTVIALE